MSIKMSTLGDDKALTAEMLREVLVYDPDTGKLFWRERDQRLFTSHAQWCRWNTRYAGKEAMTATMGHGYRHGTIFGRTYRAHRVAWAMATGSWPVDEVDHINGDRLDNRLCNLRAATHVVNMRNAKRRIDNTSGATGVFWDKSKEMWQVQIDIDGRTKHLGYFHTVSEASAARARANASMGYSLRHGS